MASTDFNELYGLGNIPNLVQGKLEKLNGSHSRRDLIDAALGVDTRSEHYDVYRRRRRDLVHFSDDHATEESPHVLLLSLGAKQGWFLRKARNIVTALRYELANNGVQIIYEQSVSGIDLEQYLSFQELIGVRPHELLAAHFIARVAPVLDTYPDMNVQFSWGDRPSEKIVRERFAKRYRTPEGCPSKTYELSPQKERVRQIFGEGSAWLEEAHR